MAIREELYLDVSPALAQLKVLDGAMQQATRNMGNGLAQASRQFTIGDVGRKLDTVGKSITRYVTLPVAAAGAASVYMAVQFESSLSKIVGLAGGSAREIDGLKSSVLALAGETGRAPKELADALYFIYSSGFKGAQALDVLKVSAKAATAGLGDTQVVADTLTSVISAYGKGNISAAKATDILVAAVKDGKAEADQLAAGIGNLAPLAAQLGVSFADVAATIAAMTKVGVDTDTAFTNLSAIFSGLLKTTPQAAQQLKAVGLNASELRRTLAEPGGILVVLRQISDAFKGNDEAMARVFPNIRALRGVMALLAQNGGEVDKVFRDVTQSSGSLEHAWKTATGTSAFKMQKALTDLKVAAIQLGEKLLPVATKIAGAIGKLADAFASLPGWAQDFLLLAAGAAAAAGPILRVAAAGIKVGEAIAAMRAGGGIAALFGLGGAGGGAAKAAAQADQLTLALKGTSAAAGTSALAIAGTTAAAVGLGAGLGLAVDKLIGTESIADGVVVSMGKLATLSWDASKGFQTMGDRVRNASAQLDNWKTIQGDTISLNKAWSMSVDQMRAAWGSQAGAVITQMELLKESFKGWKQQAAEIARTNPELANTFLRMAQQAGLPRAAIEELTQVFVRHGALLDITKAQYDALAAKYAPFIAQAQAAAQATVTQTGSLQAGAAVIRAYRDQLAQQIASTGVAERKARDLANALLGIKSPRPVTIDANDQPARAVMNRVTSTPLRNRLTIDADAGRAYAVMNALIRTPLHKTLVITTVQRAHGGVTGHPDAYGTRAGHAASGGQKWGLTWINEHGPELVWLPHGSRVIPAGQSRAAINALTAKPTFSTGGGMPRFGDLLRAFSAALKGGGLGQVTVLQVGSMREAGRMLPASVRSNRAFLYG